MNIYKKLFEKTLTEASEFDADADAQTFKKGFENPDDASAIEQEVEKLKKRGPSPALLYVEKAKEFYDFISAVSTKLDGLNSELSDLIKNANLDLDNNDKILKLSTDAKNSLYKIGTGLDEAVRQAVNHEYRQNMPETE